MNGSPRRTGIEIDVVGAPVIGSADVARVLHIEDDPVNRLLVRKLLSAAGHEVIDAESGLEGIRLAEAQRPDAVLVDINIPDLDGYEVTLRLRGMPSMQGKPIVAITAEGDRETSLAMGADGLIEKPIDAKRFAEQVAKYLAGHSERTERDSDSAEILRTRSQKIVGRLEQTVAGLSQANAKLEASAQLRQMFLQNLSHEFATPMTPVVGYLRLLLDEEAGPLTPLQRKCLESISTSTQKLRSLIDTLLDVSHLETGRLHLYERNYDFADVVQRAITETAPRFKQAGIRVVCEDVQVEMPARGDPDKLRRAMVHILDNAAKFSPRGAEVAVGIRSVGGTESAEARYQVVVADSGPGISDAEQKRILEPFYQVDGSRTRMHGGVGLGLAYARHVAEALGGSIEVRSPPQQTVAGRNLPGTAISLTVRPRPARREPQA
ncbi:MAG TPA: hybrid sensor histidine kinase/response regulator [Polyangiales bacterium]